MCSNGKLPNLKVTAAMQNLHKISAIYHTKELPALWAPKAGGLPGWLRNTGGNWQKMRISMVYV
jgi:hypothetical protein